MPAFGKQGESMKNKQEHLSPTIKRLIRSGYSPHFDPNGSWTGSPDDPNEQPVQDADDL